MKTVNNNSIWLPALLEDLFLEDRGNSWNNNVKFDAPAVNIIENLPNFVIEFAAPGFEKKDFSIEVEENILKVASKKGEAKFEGQESKKSEYIKKEFGLKNFERSFKLPKDIQTDDILANYENGILRVTLPKTEKKKELKKMVEIS